MRIMVTGGAGYIGSVVTQELIKAGHEAVVYDNLSYGHRGAVHSPAEFVEADLLDGETLRSVLRTRAIEAVMHMAAYALVGESVRHPAKYYQNNLVAGLSLLNAMNECGVKRLVFSSTCATYGEPEEVPIKENSPNRPTNPYGESKLAFERALRWYEGAYGLRSASLRYFNAAGATERCGEWHGPETHLIPLVLHDAGRRRGQYRAGRCLHACGRRDGGHNALLYRRHRHGILGERSAIYNLGCGGDGYTVREVIDTAREVTGRDIATRVAPRRAGDPAVLIASSEKIRSELGWQPEFQDLQVIIQSAWQWLLAHPRGYEE